MNKTIGFVGAGNMGKAMIGGIIKSELVNPKNIIASVKHEEKLIELNREFGIKTTANSKEVAKLSDIIFLAVKPNIYDEVMNEIKSEINESKIIINIAAGKTIASIENVLGENVKVVRSMPNTPSLVGEGMSSLCKNKNVSDDELLEIKSIFESFGKAEILPENLIDSVIGVSGSSPAYVFMFIEALADGAVLGGMPRNMAYKFAAQAVLGSAKMVLETGIHPGELKDMVCSPGGTTIEAVRSLEKNGFKSAVVEAMSSCMEKSKEMSKK
ncbi:pyrroline-5-carboxylate reductase [Clostridium ihumii]|uniref:pyrroline-5-carboxylate reductase n=1 Tax=Clostridium ihumii TaxID=1470356 RepID=UPI00058AE448|nr:pyrroline-5-carboxylate reductase [Clostridium ihumii]